MDRLKELTEAKEASERALRIIQETKEKLSSAQGWGLFDLLGGGVISSLAKRSRLDEVQKKLGELEGALDELSKQLHDVSYQMPQGPDNSFYSQFFDIGFDNIFTDFRVQREMKDLEKNLNELESDIQRVDDELVRQMEREEE